MRIAFGGFHIECSTYNPFLSPSKAKARRDDVLRGMANQGYVTQAAATAAMAKPLGV